MIRHDETCCDYSSAPARLFLARSDQPNTRHPAEDASQIWEDGQRVNDFEEWGHKRKVQTMHSGFNHDFYNLPDRDPTGTRQGPGRDPTCPLIFFLMQSKHYKVLTLTTLIKLQLTNCSLTSIKPLCWFWIVDVAVMILDHQNMLFVLIKAIPEVKNGCPFGFAEIRDQQE